jgi:hypothetical protein
LGYRSGLWSVFRSGRLGGSENEWPQLTAHLDGRGIYDYDIVIAVAEKRSLTLWAIAFGQVHEGHRPRCPTQDTGRRLNDDDIVVTVVRINPFALEPIG